MNRKFFVMMLTSLCALSQVILAKDFQLQRAQKVTEADDKLFQERLQHLTHYIYATPAESQGRVEMGRTWYDYATNNEMGRMLAHAYESGSNGIHTAFMKILPQGTTRYVNYDYYHEELDLFFGNLAITTNRQTGWGKVINGNNDAALVCLHTNPVELYQDVLEAGYTFSPILALNPGVFPGFAVWGDMIVCVAQQNNVAGQGWTAGDYFKYSTNYGITWLDGANVIVSGVVDYGNAERWPSFNPQNPPELAYLIAPASIGALYPNGSTHLATTGDWGGNWNVTLIWDDDATAPTPFGQTQYIIENFTQQNGLYDHGGVYHAVFGAVQGIRDINTSTTIDYYPILHWNSNTQALTRVNSLEYSAPDDPFIQNALTNNRPGNGLGNAYAHIARGPNPGELVCVWQQWEKDPLTGSIVLLDATYLGGIVQVFATDIWGAYSSDGGMTWSNPVHLAGNPNESDVYPNITENFIWNASNDSVYVDLLWMYDSNAGISLTNFGNATDPSECIWYYQRVAMAAGPGCAGVSGLLGDVTAENAVNAFDGLVMLSYDTGVPLPQNFLDRIAIGFGDVNEDGSTNSSDALLSMTWEVGLPVPYPVGTVVCLPLDGGAPLEGPARLSAASPDKPAALPGARETRVEALARLNFRGRTLEIPVSVNMANSGEKLGSYTLEMAWNPALLEFSGYSGGTTAGFTEPVVNDLEAGQGRLRAAHAYPYGAEGEVNLLNVRFTVKGSVEAQPGSPVSLDFSAMCAAGTFTDLLPALKAWSGAAAVSEAPASFALDNYPNPFNPVTEIRYRLPEAAEVQIVVYNVLGQKVQTLVSGQQQAGTYLLRWEGRNEQGQAAPSGIYFLRMWAEPRGDTAAPAGRGGTFIADRKLLLLK